MAAISGRLPATVKSFRAWKEQAHSFSSMEAYQDRVLNVTSADSSSHREPEQAEAIAVTPGFLPMLGVAPRLGRNFSNTEATSGNDHVALISDEFWRSRFKRRP